MATDIIKAVEQAGVVGAGGAGFPTHIKLQAKAGVVIANGCECEPLSHSDRHLMQNEPQAIIEGLTLAMQASGAKEGIVAVKAKNKAAIQALSAHLPQDKPISLHELKDYYPIGDEHLLVYEVTGKLVPPQGIPPQIEVVVCNVATLYNIVKAMQKVPVTHRYVTVMGEVAEPKTVSVPIGLSLGELLVLAGGNLTDNPAYILGGPMMGQLVYDEKLPVTKTTGALLVLDRNHSLILKKRFRVKNSRRQAASYCYQCKDCTQTCPRSLLGHDLSPHETMRQTGYAATKAALSNINAGLCSGCGLCEAYACRMGLSPLEANRRVLKDKTKCASPAAVPTPHPLRDIRFVPSGRLISRLGLRAYNIAVPYDSVRYTPQSVNLPLNQHVGAPAKALVSKGERVRVGQLVAETPTGELGAKLHSPIAGRVVETEPGLLIKH